MKRGPWSRPSEEKHEPASDIDTEVVDSLKALDPKRPIREADIDRPPMKTMPVVGAAFGVKAAHLKAC
jgi:hypothetical protein